MSRWIRRSLITLCALALVAAAASAAVLMRADQRLLQRHGLAVSPVAIRSDSAALERGHYLFDSLGCAGCHGADGAGKLMWQNGLNRLVAPHIAPGRNSSTAGYGAVDWVRAVRHGVRPDGTALLMMPSVDFNRLSDDDVGALVGYIVQLPPVDHDPGRHQLGVLMKALIGLGRMPLAPDPIDHSLPPSIPVPATVSLEHGRYVAQTCVGCHGALLTGGPIPGMPPGTPPAANLTPGAGHAISAYRDVAAFQAMLRTGKRPDGSDVAVMPFPSLSRLNPTDTAALFLYLRSLPSRATPAG